MNALNPFYRALEAPEKYAFPDTRKTIGHVCSYAPEEIVHAAGFHPMRIFPSKTRISLADTHVQAYCCSMVRGILDDRLAGRLDHLDGMVFPHTCDSMMRLSDIIRLNHGPDFFADVLLPVRLDSQSARSYMKDVLKGFKQNLEKAFGLSISDRDLRDSIHLFNRIRSLLSRLYDLKSRHPGMIRGKDLDTVVKAAMIMDRQTLAGDLAALVLELEKKAPPAFTGKRLVLAGAACTLPEIHDLIEEAGGAVVADDLCTGQRWFDARVPEEMAPMDGLVHRYQNRMICPAKHAGLNARGDQLKALAKRHKAQGLLFILIKFCDPHGFDLPFLKTELDGAGIKSQVIEVDEHQQGTGQIATRIQTFIQMI